MAAGEDQPQAVVLDGFRVGRFALVGRVGNGFGLIVVIRTLLSFSLETEIEGVAPWRRRERGGGRESR